MRSTSLRRRVRLPSTERRRPGETMRMGAKSSCDKSRLTVILPVACGALLLMALICRRFAVGAPAAIFLAFVTVVLYAGWSCGSMRLLRGASLGLSGKPVRRCVLTIVFVLYSCYVVFSLAIEIATNNRKRHAPGRGFVAGTDATVCHRRIKDHRPKQKISRCGDT